MTQKIRSLLILVLLISFFIFPEAVKSGAVTGLTLWYKNVLPILLPFAILSGLFIESGTYLPVCRLIGTIICPILGCSVNGCYAILNGLLCGYPMGAKSIHDLLLHKKISALEARTLLPFCNQVSPAFLIHYVLTEGIKDPALFIPFVIFLYVPAFLVYLILNRHHFTAFVPSKEMTDRRNQNGIPILLDQCITESILTIVKVGGYIMLFSIFMQILQVLLAKVSPGYPVFSIFALIPAVLELTSGIAIVSSASLAKPLLFSMILFLTSFGGLCTVFQTKSILQSDGISIRDYIKIKLVTAFVTSLLAFLYMVFIKNY